MKMILASLAVATLMATPVFAQPHRNEGSLASAIHLKHKKQLGVDYRDLYLSVPKSNQPTLTTDQLEQEVCSTAHDFCPGYYGDNG
jgi:hypothetical protein